MKRLIVAVGRCHIGTRLGRAAEDRIRVDTIDKVVTIDGRWQDSADTPSGRATIRDHLEGRQCPLSCSDFRNRHGADDPTTFTTPCAAARDCRCRVVLRDGQEAIRD